MVEHDVGLSDSDVFEDEIVGKPRVGAIGDEHVSGVVDAAGYSGGSGVVHSTEIQMDP